MQAVAIENPSAGPGKLSPPSIDFFMERAKAERKVDRDIVDDIEKSWNGAPPLARIYLQFAPNKIFVMSYFESLKWKRCPGSETAWELDEMEGLKNSVITVEAGHLFSPDLETFISSELSRGSVWSWEPPFYVNERLKGKILYASKMRLS